MRKKTVFVHLNKCTSNVILLQMNSNVTVRLVLYYFCAVVQYKLLVTLYAFYLCKSMFIIVALLSNCKYSVKWLSESIPSYTSTHACDLAPCGFHVYSLVNKSQPLFAYNECTLAVAHSQLQPSSHLPECTASIYHSSTCDLPNTLDPVVNQSLTTPRPLSLMPSLAPLSLPPFLWGSPLPSGNSSLRFQSRGCSVSY